MAWAPQYFPLRLECDDAFAKASREVIEAICNGCGDGWRDKLIPDTMYGLSVRPACEIHDWDYHFGRTAEDKDSADNRFLTNLITIIEARSANTATVFLRRRRALKYYEAVTHLGGDPFWKGKQRP